MNHSPIEYISNIKLQSKNENLIKKQNDSTSNFKSGSGGMIRPYINDNLNSRIDHNLPEGIWRIKWKSQLLNGLSPEFILQSGDRIIVQGSQVWQLFDIDGKPIAANNFANSDVAIDPTNSLIYTADYNSMFRSISACKWRTCIHT